MVAATAEQVLAAARAPGARATLVNVWATWCGPCRQEFPDLVRIAKDYRNRGLRVVLVSADFDDQVPAVRAFLRSHGYDQRSLIKTGDDMEFINTLDPKWSGAIPATFIYDASGRLSQFWEGMSTYQEFENGVRHALDATSGGDRSPEGKTS